MKLEKCNTINCFANRDGRCEILTDARSNGKPCPFYKHESEVNKAEIEEACKLHSAYISGRKREENTK